MTVSLRKLAGTVFLAGTLIRNPSSREMEEKIENRFYMKYGLLDQNCAYNLQIINEHIPEITGRNQLRSDIDNLTNEIHNRPNNSGSSNNNGNSNNSSTKTNERALVYRFICQHNEMRGHFRPDIFREMERELRLNPQLKPYTFGTIVQAIIQNPNSENMSTFEIVQRATGIAKRFTQQYENGNENLVDGPTKSWSTLEYITKLCSNRQFLELRVTDDELLRRATFLLNHDAKLILLSILHEEQVMFLPYHMSINPGFPAFTINEAQLAEMDTQLDTINTAIARWVGKEDNKRATGDYSPGFYLNVQNNELLPRLIGSMSENINFIGAYGQLIGLNFDNQQILNFSYGAALLGLERAIRLNRDAGIIYFMRYSRTALEETYMNLMENSRTAQNSTLPQQPLGVIIFGRSDWNGAFYVFDKANQDRFAATYRTIVFEASTDQEFEQRVRRVQRIGKIDALIIGGHGDFTNIQLGGVPLPWRIDTGDNRFANLRNSFVTEPVIGLISCDTGITHFPTRSIAQQISRWWSATVIAPEGSPAINNIEIIMRNNRLYDIHYEVPRVRVEP